MSGAAALLAASFPAHGQDQEEGMVLRRPKRPGEDDYLYLYGQLGPRVPATNAMMVRSNDLNIVVHYPRYTYRAPLVVFSHGALGDPQVYRSILDHWVSHGFVVAAPVHDDSIFQRGLLARRAGAGDAGVWEIDKLLNDSQAWIDRARACVRPLDIYDRLSETIQIKIDIDRPIIIGHELGAFVAGLELGTIATSSEGNRIAIADPRWFAGCLLSPQGAGFMGLDDKSWEGVTRPLLVIQGGEERDFTNQTPAQKIDPFWKSPVGNKHLGWFPTGDRQMFTDSHIGIGDKTPEDFENLCGLTTAFLDAYANYKDDVFQMLAGDWLYRASLRKVETNYR